MCRQILVSLFILVSASSDAEASIAIAQSKEKLFAEADLVIVGRVIGSEGIQLDFHDVNGGDGEIFTSKNMSFTEWNLEVLETLQGRCNRSPMKVTALGSEWSISFTLQDNDTALFFLNWNELNEKWIPPGMSSRVFLIEDYGGRNQLIPTGATAVVLAPDQQGIRRTGTLLNAETLDDFAGRKSGCVEK